MEIFCSLKFSRENSSNGRNNNEFDTSVENETTYLKRRYHIEDYIAIQNIPPNAYARILHFILMPIFSIHTPYIISEISRLSGFFVFYYRLEESSLSTLVKREKSSKSIAWNHEA